MIDVTFFSHLEDEINTLEVATPCKYRSGMKREEHFIAVVKVRLPDKSKYAIIDLTGRRLLFNEIQRTDSIQVWD